ncbi:MAG: hypothetical protein KAY37_05120 [Phycisphaerae bacterium]|nr:hypothetical protein [Phycisphaerae bacterium]
MADYIPGGDAAFNAWLDNFVEALIGAGGKGLTASRFGEGAPRGVER